MFIILNWSFVTVHLPVLENNENTCFWSSWSELNSYIYIYTNQIAKQSLWPFERSIWYAETNPALKGIYVLVLEFEGPGNYFKAWGARIRAPARNLRALSSPGACYTFSQSHSFSFVSKYNDDSGNENGCLLCRPAIRHHHEQNVGETLGQTKLRP